MAKKTKKPTMKQRCKAKDKGHAQCVLFNRHAGDHLDENGRAWRR